MGESAYNPDLPAVVDELMTKGIAEVSEGAKVVFINEMANKDGEAPVFIIQKTGGKATLLVGRRPHMVAAAANFHLDDIRPLVP